MKDTSVFTLGLCGSIGSGKSTIARLFQILGFPCYNSDMRAKWLNDHSPVIRQGLIRQFGDELYPDPSKGLDRAALAKIIFDDTLALKAANAIIHPEVERDFMKWRRDLNVSYCLLESAILYTSAFSLHCNRILRVEAPIDLRIERLLMRDRHSTRVELLKRIASQSKEEQLAKQADFSISNHSPYLLLPQIDDMLQRMGFDIKSLRI